MYYVYILENNKGWHYTGSCQDLQKRVKRHNQNSVRSTKNKGPFKLVHYEEVSSKREARIKENQIKRYKNASYYIDLAIRNKDPIV